TALNGTDIAVFNGLSHFFSDFITCFTKSLGTIDNIGGEVTTFDTFCEWIAEHFFGVFEESKSFGVTTVFFGNNDVLADVDQTTGQVTSIRCTKRGIGQTFTSTVSRKEVFQRVQAFLVVGFNWKLHGFTGSVNLNPDHTNHLVELFQATTSTRGDHHSGRNEWVVGNRTLKEVFDFLFSLFPETDNHTTTFTGGDKTFLELVLNSGNLFVGSSD